jgi:hypothetical protein
MVLHALSEQKQNKNIPMEYHLHSLNIDTHFSALTSNFDTFSSFFVLRAFCCSIFLFSHVSLLKNHNLNLCDHHNNAFKIVKNEYFAVMEEKRSSLIEDFFEKGGGGGCV